MLKGNKGEWSEIYALLKVLSDKHLYAGDEDLNKIEKLIFPIVKILRGGSNQVLEFAYDDDIVVVNNNEEQFRISLSEFTQNASLLLSKLQKANSRSFEVSAIETFLNSFNCNSLKAKSSLKSDIRIVIHDYRTGIDPELGFSIKSQIGSSSTLLNASASTNFIYRVNGTPIMQHDIDRINSIDTRTKIKDRIEEIKNLSGSFEFLCAENLILGSNLTLIDSMLPSIIADMLLQYYTSNFSKTIDLINDISMRNPLNYQLIGEHPFYVYKMKRFLTDVALGMMPATVWKGQYDATGGYLIVKDNGEVLCYHIYNRNEFENYLLQNTKFDTPSSTRHGFGKLFEENGELKFKLNLQIRFVK